MKNKMKRVFSIVLALVMMISVIPQLAVPAEAAFSFSTTSTGDDWDNRTGLPDSCSGKAVVALFFNGDTFPGEPRTHSGANYVSYNTSLEKGSANFKASEILQNVIGSSNYVMGENSKLFGYYWSATSGIFDPNGLDDEYFTDTFRSALAEREQAMIADVIAAKIDASQSVGSENPADYEIVWYVIKYQTIDSTWHINGLIREKDKYSVIYDGNGATVGSPPDGVIDMSYSDALNYTVQDNENGLDRDGYQFVGWNTEADGSGIFYTGGQTADLTLVGKNPITLYAQWAEETKYNITWIDGDGNTIHMDTALAGGAAVTYDGATPTKTPTNTVEYVFDGWAKTAGGSKVYEPDGEVIAGDVDKLYAHFTEKTRTYTVTWVNHTVIETDSGLAHGSSTGYDGEIPTRSTTETEGYLFAGWATTENGAVQYALRDPVTVNGDMTMYAQFTLVPMRTVTWYNEDGTVQLATQRALEGSAVNYPNAAPTKAGNTFSGWATAANGTAVYAAGAPVTVNGNMNLYADFEPTKHTVIWKNWDGSVLETDSNVPYGTTPEYNGAIPLRADDVDKTYTFIGWTPDIDTVTGDITYTAAFAETTRAYTVIWKNYDGSVLKTEQVNHGVTPSYSGETPVCPETATHSHEFVGWTPTISAVPDNADGTGTIIYTAKFTEVEKLFTATVKIWKDPTVDSDSGLVTSGTPADIDDVTSHTALYLRDLADSTNVTALSKTATGTYTAALAHGNYEVVVSDGAGGYTRIIEERIVLPLDGASSDPDSTSADIIFYSVTYDFAGGTVGGNSSVVEYYQRGTDVTVTNYAPTRSEYIFDNWQLDENTTDTYVRGQRITVLGGGIIQPHTLTAKWIRANDQVNINLTIHHHADPALSGAIGMNPAPGSTPINLDLSYRAEGSSGDYWEEGKKYEVASNWVTVGNTVNKTASESGTGYATSTTTLEFGADTTGFKNLSHVWDYSANILLEDYFLTKRDVVETVDSVTGDVTYTVNATLQYRPDLFNMGYTVEIDQATIDAGLTPTAVDLKILSYKDSAWSPISRHQSTSVEARFDGSSIPVSGSYGVPVKDQLDNDFYYRVSVVGFTLPDGTELSATGGLVDYSSTATGSTATYKYAAGAYTAVVTVEDGVSAIGNVPAVYGVATTTTVDGKEVTTYSQAGKVTVTVSAHPHTVTFKPNGGTLGGSTEDTVVNNQFRIPVLGDYIPTRAGNYVFDGWYIADENGDMTDTPAETGDAIDEDKTLIARWKEPLTVSGEIRLNTHYLLDGNSVPIPAYELPTKLTVTLERTTASNDKIIVQVKEISGIDYTTYAANYLGWVGYAFDPVPQDGSTYRVYVAAANYQAKFLNEPEADTPENITDYNKYDADHAALDDDGDNDAAVYVALTFTPVTYDLTWKVDSTAIADDFRPESLGVVVQYNANDGKPNYADWPVISQHYNNGSYHPETIGLTSGTVIDSFPVWKTHTDGDAYDYAVRVHEWTADSNTISYNSATAPFTVTYNPAVAWYEGGKQVTADSSEDNLIVILAPKTYTITYDLNAGADPVQGMNGEPVSHTWSYKTNHIPLELNRDGYDFLGWTANVSGYAEETVDGVKMGTISADTAEDITLTAQWRKQKEVTFKVVNGTWDDGTTADIIEYVSLDADSNGSVMVPTGMIPLYGYGDGNWDDPAITDDSLAVTGSEPVAYTYSFVRLYHSVGYDTDGADGIDTSDSVAHGNYVRVDPAGGVWNESSSVQDVRIEEDLGLTAPIRGNYIFAGWHRHYAEDTTTYPGSTVTHRYVAQWLRDENGDGIADTLQKKIIFNIENGTWDGINSDPIVKFVTLDGSGKADISSVIPTGMQPRTGFVAEKAFWSPALPTGNIVSGNGEVSFTYRHYTTITYSDFTQDGKSEQLLILPGSYIGIDPAGGSWDGNTSQTITQINGPYILADAVYTNHDFLGWQLNSVSGEAAHIFTAQWKKDTYTIRWENHDGNLLEEDAAVELGDMPEYNGEMPTKASTAEFDYTFKGWTPEVIAAEANTTYTAEFTATRRSYTVTWKNWDGSVLDTDTVEYGQMPAFASVPSRPANDEYTYTFAGWENGEMIYNSASIPAVTGDVTYTATYSQTKNQYTITWLNEDGTELQSGLVDYGTMPTAPDDPTKTATAQYTYIFDRWTPAVASVTGDAVYRATYSSTVNKYTVTWYEEDGVTVIATEEVEYGKVPVAPAAPAKENTDQYSYTFSGWKNGEITYIPASIPAVTGDVSYTAKYAETVNKYTVTWLNYNNVMLETDTLVDYGTAPSFESSAKLTTEDANNDYEFLGWYLSTDEEKTVVVLAEQTVTGNVTYIAKYNVTSKARTVTVNVWVNATASDGTGGTLSTIGTVTNGLRGNVYLVPEASVADSSTYIQASWNDTAKAYAATLMPGNYLIYAGNTASGAVREANQIVSIVNANVTVNTLYNSVTYNAGDGSFEGGEKTLTEYYKSGSGPVYVSQAVPTLADQVFTHWHDAASNVYNASTTAVPVKLIDSITTGYTLTAHWATAKDITVVVNINPASKNSQTDPTINSKTLSLQLTGSSAKDGTYVDIYGTGKTVAMNSLTAKDDGTYTYTAVYSDQRGDYFYQATALLTGYERTGITVSPDGKTVTVNLQYDPAGFDLIFKVVVDSDVPEELVPRAVDVQLVFYDRVNSAWKLVPGFESRAIEVPLTKIDGIWQGTGSYHVWSKYTTAPYTDQLYLYRIAVTDFDLGVSRGSLDAINGTGADAFKVYSSIAGNYHPAGAYTAEVTVLDQVENCTDGTAGGLLGSHDSNGTQHGTITATVKVHPYTVVQHYNDGATADQATNNVFLTPTLDTPTFAGHTFAGWWTKDGRTTGDWGTQITSAGIPIMKLSPAGSTLNLYARWKSDLTVKGDVTVSNLFEGKVIYEHDRPVSVTVELLNEATDAVLQSKTISLTDAASGEYRTGFYEFDGVPNNGTTYRVTVAVPNFDQTYRNETAADENYTTEMYSAVDKDEDNDAEVDIHLVFNPHSFALEYTVDASAVGSDYRPGTAGIVILSGESGTDPQKWNIITQQKQGETVSAHEIDMDDNGRAKAHEGSDGIWHHYDVWRRSASGQLYEYAIQLWSLKHGERTYTKTDIDTAPFTVIYSPTRAWYDSATNKQATPPSVLSSGITLTHPDPDNPNGLVAYIVPKSYTVTYELGRTGTVSGVTSIDGNTARGSFLWSHGQAELPIATPTGASGVTFGGWYTQDGRTTGDWGSKVEEIDANTMDNVTLYARWVYTVTWNADNGDTPISESVLEGTVPTAPADPTKDADSRYSYTFAGWSPAVAAVTGNVTYTAQYNTSTNSYTVTWKNGEETLDTDTVAYGEMPAYTGATPTKASTEQYSYTFSGWTPALATVTGNVTYTATFTETLRSYAVTWKNYDGSTLDTDANVGYGVLPSYDGVTPSKTGDAQHSYTFTGWSPAVVTVTGDATYTAQFEQSVNTYTVTWKNWDGTPLETDSGVAYGTMPSYNGAEPSRPATDALEYHYFGWDKKVETVTGDVVYTANYYSTTRTYIVTWKNSDGTVLETDPAVPFGTTPKYDGETPTKAADAQYTYTFDKWFPDVSSVTGDATYTATYSTTVNKYTVTWIDDNGDVLKSEQLEYGATPSFGGTPTKTADAQYTYSFDGWTPSIVDVTENATYTATYTGAVNKYTVTWVNWNDTVLETDIDVPYGTTPTYNGGNPTPPTIDGHTVTWNQWDKVVVAVTGDTTYKAVFVDEANKYTVTWKNGDSVLETDTDVPYGSMPSYDGVVPTKAGDTQYSYTHNGWTPAVETVTGDVIYTATFAQTVNSYTITWKNENGDVLKTDHVAYGSTPSYTGTTPVKAETAEFSYTHDSWTPAIAPVSGDATYTATFTAVKRSYTITWQDEDGTQLDVDTVEYGATPSYDGPTPAKAATGRYTYTHSGWAPAVKAVTGNATYKATYSMHTIPYKVVWKNADGTVLRTDFMTYGDTPVYGATPSKTGDAQYSYTFDAWTPSIVAVTGNAEYKATYTQHINKYTVTWKNDGGAVLATEQVEYNTVPTYTGTPTKAADAQYTYTFAGWDNTPVAVTGDVTYTATYSTTVNTYTVTWVNWDDTVLETDADVPYGTTPSFDGADPTRPDTAEHVFTWNLWDQVIAPVTGDVTYKAIFVDTANTYTVVWKNYDGTVLETDTDVPFGAMPSYDGAVPAKVSSAQHSYAHSGWAPAVQTVSGDAEYTATFAQTVNSYTITYTDGVDGAEIFADQTYTAEYGAQTPAFVGTPARNGYTFGGWSSAVSDTVTGDVVYTAQWTANTPAIPVVPPAATTGTAKLVKVDANDQNTRLPGVVFELCQADGTFLGSYKTDTNGEITVSSLAPGEYYWHETRPAEGYILDGTKHTIIVSAGKTAAITVTNTHSVVPSVFSGNHHAYIVGYADGSVHPEAYITRAEVATIFFRMLDDETRAKHLTKENSFPDVEAGMWFNTAVSTMAAMGILNGYPDGDFHPNANITRAEFAAIAARFDVNGNTTGASFTDIYKHWAKREINIATNNGWILGYEDGEFKPNQNITRAEAMAMVNRVLQRIPQSKGDLLDAMVKWPDNMDTTKWYYLTVQEATNSHDHSRKSNGYEYWTGIREVPDWAALER